MYLSKLQNVFIALEGWPTALCFTKQTPLRIKAPVLFQVLSRENQMRIEGWRWGTWRCMIIKFRICSNNFDGHNFNSLFVGTGAGSSFPTRATHCILPQCQTCAEFAFHGEWFYLSRKQEPTLKLPNSAIALHCIACLAYNVAFGQLAHPAPLGVCWKSTFTLIWIRSGWDRYNDSIEISLIYLESQHLSWSGVGQVQWQCWN